MSGNQKKWMQENGGKLVLSIFIFMYIFSFLLTAYSERLGLYGYECAYLAFAVVFDPHADIDGGFLPQLLTKGHFLLLGLHNIVVPVCLVLYKKLAAGYYRWVVSLLTISILNTALFFFYNNFGGQIADEELLLGYYVWVFASVLIYVSLKWRRGGLYDC